MVAKKKAARGVMAVASLHDIFEAAQCVREIGEAEREMVTITTEMNEQIEAVKESFAERARVCQEQLEGLVGQLFEYANANKTALTREGVIKTVMVPTGSFGWRMSPKSVEIDTSAKEVLAYLEHVKLEQFIRRKPEINKASMLAQEALAATVPGIRIEQHEDFVVKPASVTAEVSARPGKRKLKIEVVEPAEEKKSSQTQLSVTEKLRRKKSK